MLAGLTTTRIFHLRRINLSFELRNATPAVSFAAAKKTKRGGLRCGSDSGKHKKWKATLCHKGRKIHLGYFENEIDAR